MTGELKIPMIERLNKILRMLTAISKPFEEVSWIPSVMRSSKVQEFCDPIQITLPDNQDLISFLEANDRRIVFLDTHIEAGFAVGEQVDRAGRENINPDSATSPFFHGISVQLSNIREKPVSAIFTSVAIMAQAALQAAEKGSFHSKLKDSSRSLELFMGRLLPLFI
jgi:hypothetical protein